MISYLFDGCLCSNKDLHDEANTVCSFLLSFKENESSSCSAGHFSASALCTDDSGDDGTEVCDILFTSIRCGDFFLVYKDWGEDF